MTYGKKILFSLINIGVAELIWELIKVFREYKYHSTKYPLNDRLLRIISYTFCLRNSLILLFAVVMAIVFNQNQDMPHFLNDIWSQSHLIPIVWMYRMLNTKKSILDYAEMIRSDSGLDFATGMAASYFHGYLNLVLPNRDKQEGIANRIEKYENEHGVVFAVKKLVILIPSSLYTKPVIASQIMERQERTPLKGVRLDRAGVSRPYTNDVYQILIDDRRYYISVEGATPLLSYFDSLHHVLTSTVQMHALQREITRKFYKYLKNLLEKWPATHDQFELVYYSDFTIDGRPVDVGEVLYERIKMIWRKENTIPH